MNENYITPAELYEKQMQPNKIKKTVLAVIIALLILILVVILMRQIPQEKIIPYDEICHLAWDKADRTDLPLNYYIETDTNELLCIFDNGLEPYIPSDENKEIQITNPDYQVCYRIFEKGTDEQGIYYKYNGEKCYG